MKITWKSLTAPKGNIRVRVLKGDKALEFAFAHAFKQHFYSKRIGGTVDGISNPIVTFTTLDSMPKEEFNYYENL